MKAGDILICNRWPGSGFTAGNTYTIRHITPTNGMVLVLCNTGEERSLQSYMIGDKSFHFSVLSEAGYSMPEPMFDLDDMELAEIMIEEMKNA